jgi:glucitol operon activator protein
VTWQAVLVLVGAFGLALVLSLLQHRAYARAVNQVAADEHREGVVLVTGRA